MTMRIEDRRRRQSATALDTALRATPVDELDERIGEAAVTEYEETVTKATLDASEAILSWWRAQDPLVVEQLLDALREREANAVFHLEELTETTGIALLGELLRDSGMNNGRWAYEREIRHRLDTIRAESKVPDDSETPSLDAALGTLDSDELSIAVGLTATDMYATRVANEAHEAGLEIVRRWQHLPAGYRALEELIGTLESNHPEEFANATKSSAGGASNDLVELLRDDITRELYERLVTELGTARTRPAA